MQIKSRLTIRFMFLFALILGLALYSFYLKYEEIIIKDSFESIKAYSSRFAEQIVLKLPFDSRPASVQDSSSIPKPISIEIFDSNFKRKYALPDHSIRSENINLLKLLDKNDFHQLDRNREELKVGFTIKHNHEKYYVLAIRSMDKNATSEIRNLLLMTFFISLLVAGIGGWWFTSHALKPFNEIIHQVDGFHPSNIKVRLKEVQENDEVSHLIATFNRMLDRVEEALNNQKNFISNVAHELKNPIAIMSSQIEVLLQSKNRPEEEYQKTLDSLLRDCFRLNDTTDNLLQLARIYSDEGKMIWLPIRIEELLLESCSFLLRSYPDYKIEINYQGEPQSEEDLIVYGNKSLLRSAFMNLMDNCCKYSPNHAVDVKMAFEPEGKRTLQFKDEGPGITESEIKNIFKPFYRDPKTRYKRGTGIGLTLVESVTRLHHIEIAIESKLNIGTNFILHLPDKEWNKIHQAEHETRII